MVLGVVDKVIESRVELSLIGDVHLVELLINPVVFWVVLELGLEVITILLLFLSQISEEESVVSDPSITLPVEHSPLSALVVDWISHSSCIKLLHLVEDTVEFHNRLLNLIPCLVHITTKWYLLLVSKILHLFIDNLVGRLEGIDLFMCLLLLLHLISWINKNTISFVIVDVDVHIGPWQRLHLMRWTITEVLGQWYGEVLLGHLEVHDVCEHG